MWIGFDPANPKCQTIKEAALIALKEGATGLTITSSEAAMPDAPLTMPSNPPTARAVSANAPTPCIVPADADVEVGCVWGHLYTGKMSRKYLQLAAEYGDANDTEKYTFSDLDASDFTNGIDGVRAAHRNVGRAMKDEGVKLFDDKNWDSNRKCQVFTLKKAHREEILRRAAADSDLE